MSPSSLSRVESAVRLAADYVEGFNRHDVEALVGLLSEDCVFEGFEDGPDGAALKGREAIARRWGELFCAAPDLRLEVEEVFGLGLRAVLRWRRSWTAADGQKRSLRGVELFTASQELLREIRSYAKG